MRVRIYVDGSTYPHNPGASGVAFHAILGDRIRVGWAPTPHWSSNQVEIAALLYVFETLPLTPLDFGVIFTDCLYVTGGADPLTLGLPCSTVGSMLRKARTELLRLSGIALDHVRGHTGVEGNEAADFHAKQAARLSATCRSPLYIPAGVPELKLIRLFETEIIPNVARLPLALQREVRRKHKALCSGDHSTGISAQFITGLRAHLQFRGRHA